MTKEQKIQKRRALAQRTALGRFLCRLCGDEAGQTLMEYVVLGVLIVAAVVGLVVAFGGSIKDSFVLMIDAIRGDQPQLQTDKAAQTTQAATAVSTGSTTYNAVATPGASTSTPTPSPGE